jgi:hypothetical protein
MNNTDNTAVSNDTAVTRSYTADGEPTLQSYNLNMRNNELTLVFNEPIKNNSLDASGITLKTSVVGQTDTEVRLTNNSTTSSVSGNNLIVTLSREDINTIKPTVNGTGSNVKLNMKIGTVTDINNNNNPAVVDMTVTTFSDDNVGPALLSYNLNLKTNKLTLSFDEPIKTDFFTPEKITLKTVDSAGNQLVGQTRTLSNNTAASINGNNATISLTDADVNYIKYKFVFDSTGSNVRINMGTGTVKDMNNTQNTEVSNNTAVTSSHTADDVSPALQSYHLNMKTNQLTLGFDEPIKNSSFDPTKITLKTLDTSGYNVTSTVTLTNNGTTSSVDGNSLIITLANNDINTIKPTLNPSSGNNIRLDASGAVTDMNDNHNTAESNMTVTNFSQDNVGPELLSYHLNMRTNKLILSFNEPLKTDSHDRTKITLEIVNTDNQQIVEVQPNNTPVISGNNVEIEFTNAESNTIKKTLVSNSGNNVKLKVEAAAVKDMNNKPNTAVSTTTTTTNPARTFTPDNVGPTLQSYDLDMNLNKLTMTFNEPMTVM